MKRSWIGAGILLALLLCAGLVTWSMDAIHEPVDRALLQARNAALEGQWGSARSLAAEAERAWSKWSHFRACFSDHGPMEEVEAAFARLEACSAAGEESEFAALAAETARKVRAMSQAHGLTLWNLL